VERLLDEAERNRDAAASIGIVRNTTQKKVQTIRVLSARRVIVAFYQASDDADVLRTVVQLMRASAIAAVSRRDVEGLETAEEHIRAAAEMLGRINAIRKASGSIRKDADAIDTECNTVHAGVARHLGQARDALAGVALEAIDLIDEPSPETRERGLTGTGRSSSGDAAGPPTNPNSEGALSRRRQRDKLVNRKNVIRHGDTKLVAIRQLHVPR